MREELKAIGWFVFVVACFAAYAAARNGGL